MPTTTITDRWSATSTPFAIIPADADRTSTPHPIDDSTEDVFDALRRYLLTGGTDVVPALSAPITVADAAPVRDALAHDSLRVVAETLAATAAVPLRPEPLLLALAMASAVDDDLTRRAALTALPRVARTSRDLFLFATFVQGLRGWGRGLRRAIGAWYNNRPLAELVDDVLATPGSAGWRHADLLRLGHPKAATPGHDALYRWLVTGSLPIDLVPDPDDAPILARLHAHNQLRSTTDGETAAELIAAYALPLASVPDAFRTDSAVWSALVPHLPITELLAGIPALARTGTLSGNPVLTRAITARIDPNRSAMNPLAIVPAIHAVATAAIPGGTAMSELRTALDNGLVRSCRRWSRSLGAGCRLAIDPAIAIMPTGPDGVRPVDVAAVVTMAGALANWPAPVVSRDRLVPVPVPALPSLEETTAAVLTACAGAGPIRTGRSTIMTLTTGPILDTPALPVEFASRSTARSLPLADPARVVVAGIDAGALTVVSRLFLLGRP